MSSRKPPARSPGVVIAVDAAKTEHNGFKLMRIPEVVVVKTRNGETHNFITGSRNAVDAKLRKVGQQGYVRWIEVPGSYTLPFFKEK